MRQRIRRRYISIQVETEKPIDEKALYEAIWISLLRLFGEYTASKTELAMIRFDPETKQAILRCSHDSLDAVKASIVALTEANDGKAVARIRIVSGTLKTLGRRHKSLPI